MATFPSSWPRLDKSFCTSCKNSTKFKDMSSLQIDDKEADMDISDASDASDKKIVDDDLTDKDHPSMVLANQLTNGLDIGRPDNDHQFSEGLYKTSIVSDSNSCSISTFNISTSPTNSMDLSNPPEEVPERPPGKEASFGACVARIISLYSQLADLRAKDAKCVRALEIYNSKPAQDNTITKPSHEGAKASEQSQSTRSTPQKDRTISLARQQRKSQEAELKTIREEEKTVKTKIDEAMHNLNKFVSKDPKANTDQRSGEFDILKQESVSLQKSLESHSTAIQTLRAELDQIQTHQVKSFPTEKALSHLEHSLDLDATIISDRQIPATSTDIVMCNTVLPMDNEPANQPERYTVLLREASESIATIAKRMDAADGRIEELLTTLMDLQNQNSTLMSKAEARNISSTIHNNLGTISARTLALENQYENTAQAIPEIQAALQDCKIQGDQTRVRFEEFNEEMLKAHSSFINGIKSELANLIAALRSTQDSMRRLGTEHDLMIPLVNEGRDNIARFKTQQTATQQSLVNLVQQQTESQRINAKLKDLEDRLAKLGVDTNGRLEMLEKDKNEPAFQDQVADVERLPASSQPTATVSNLSRQSMLATMNELSTRISNLDKQVLNITKRLDTFTMDHFLRSIANTMHRMFPEGADTARRLFHLEQGLHNLDRFATERLTLLQPNNYPQGFEIELERIETQLNMVADEFGQHRHRLEEVSARVIETSDRVNIETLGQEISSLLKTSPKFTTSMQQVVRRKLRTDFKTIANDMIETIEANKESVGHAISECSDELKSLRTQVESQITTLTKSMEKALHPREKEVRLSTAPLRDLIRGTPKEESSMMTPVRASKALGTPILKTKKKRRLELSDNDE